MRARPPRPAPPPPLSARPGGARHAGWQPWLDFEHRCLLRHGRSTLRAAVYRRAGLYSAPRRTRLCVLHGQGSALSLSRWVQPRDLVGGGRRCARAAGPMPGRREAGRAPAAGGRAGRRPRARPARPGTPLRRPGQAQWRQTQAPPPGRRPARRTRARPPPARRPAGPPPWRRRGVG